MQAPPDRRGFFCGLKTTNRTMTQSITSGKEARLNARGKRTLAFGGFYAAGPGGSVRARILG